MENDLKAIEVTEAQAKKAVELKDALVKLTSNSLFEKVILTGYFENEASRLVLLKAEPSLQDDENQKAIDKGIIAIGEVRQYLRVIMHLGTQAEKSLVDCAEERVKVLEEDTED